MKKKSKKDMERIIDDAVSSLPPVVEMEYLYEIYVSACAMVGEIPVSIDEMRAKLIEYGMRKMTVAEKAKYGIHD